MTFKLLTATAVAALTAMSAQAATIDYTLGDHPDRAIQSSDYGIRLDVLKDYIPSFFSFENGGAEATLSIDVHSNTASITGTVMQNKDGTDYDLWDISYDWVGVTLTDMDNGYFTSTSGSGTLSNQNSYEQISLAGKAETDGGTTFTFDDSRHRLGDYPDFGDEAGWGWVDVGYSSGPCLKPDGLSNGDDGDDECGTRYFTYSGANDFLFTATADGGGDGPDGEIPLPAAGWMLLAGLGALRVMKKRKA